MRNYVPYHLHTDLSLLDSCTKYTDYIDMAVSYNMKAIGFSEHGNIFNWIEKKMYCDKKGIKYLHCCEVYLTKQLSPKIKDNYHTILISKNQKGVLELNTLIDKSTQEDHFYYKPRITFDEFLQISDNVIKISACTASPLNRLSENDIYYDKLLSHYDYYEIQYHNDSKQEQIEYNKKLYYLSNIYNKPLIASGDFHSSNQYKSECRKILKTAKKMSYDDEDEYDLTFKNYDEFIYMFKIQNSLPLDIVLEAVNNTNIMADSCEDIILDTNYKYPKLSDNDEELFVNTIYKKYRDKLSKKIISNNNKYLDNIQEEIRVIKKIGMCSFMLFMSELCTWCRDNNIPIGFCRGSVGGSTVAYILDIIDVNPVIWNTVFSRFANEDRVEIGDIDLDFSPSQRERVFEYIINRFGYDKSAFILAIGTISDKGTIDEIGRALNYDLPLVSKIKEEYDKNAEETKLKYNELFYYFDGLLGTSISQSQHPAGIIASPISLYDNYGCFWNNNKRIMQINMEEVHEVNLVKYDILGLKNIEIIKDTYSILGKEYPLSHEINWEDKNVWDNLTISPVGVFQFEGNYAFDLLKLYKPSKINDLSLVNASLRPSGASYRDRLIARQFNNNPSEQIDELLKDNNGFLVFQEDTIKFLTDICGLTGSEADNVRRAIGRKQVDRLEKALPRILEGYCSVSPKSRDIAEKEAKEFLKIIEDSSNYQFGFNHSTGYSMIGYLCAYLRYYHPLEFITSYLNNANNEDDIITGTQLANELSIRIEPSKFGYSSGKYTPNKENKSIYKGVGSIKYLNEEVGEQLYNLSKAKKYDNFLDLLIDINDNTSCNSRQLDILVKLDYFSEFAKAGKLLEFIKLFNMLYGKKAPKKDTIAKQRLNDLLVGIIAKHSVLTPSTYSKFNSEACLRELWDNTRNFDLKFNDKIYFQQQILGYISYTNPDINKRYIVITDINTKYTPVVDTYCLNNSKTAKCKIAKKLYKDKDLKVGDIIYIHSMEKKFGYKKVGEDGDGKPCFQKDFNKIEWHITDYNVIKDIENMSL